MQILDFMVLKEAVQKKLDGMSNTEWFVTDTVKDDLYDLYLDSFPEGTNEVYRERREYDCSCCRQFLKTFGNVVSIKNGKLVSMWDIEVGGQFQPVVDALSAYVKSKPIRSIFLSKEPSVGTNGSNEILESGLLKEWDHFYYKIPSQYLIKGSASLEYSVGEINITRAVFKRSLEELTQESAEVVKELIEQNSLYRGQEHIRTIDLFLKCKKEFTKLEGSTKENYLWSKSVELEHSARFRNSVIGTLLIDLSEGKELEVAVKSFESKVAPHNYKRPKALITSGMIDKAQKKVEELGIQDSLQRRFAVMEDITINNVLFADRSAKNIMNGGGIFDDLKKEVSDKKPDLNKVEEVSVEDFLEKILPKAESLELYVENRHSGNFTSLISPTDQNAPNILKWGNNFSWSYNGEVTDSIAESVRAAGGNVDGDLVFSHEWNHNDKNKSLMDLHVFFDGVGSRIPRDGEEEIHDNYPTKASRVGWNNRQHSFTGGVQDVDFVNPPKDGQVPVENICFPSINRLPEGIYTFKIHNWKFRATTTEGFKARLAFNNGEVYHYEHKKPLKNKQWITVAQAELKDGKFTMLYSMPTTTTSKEVWGINTHKWQKVSTVMNSPNHWDGEETGNKHLFFMLKDCVNPEKARGFYNEFLSNDLIEHRKVFEVLGSKMKTEESEEQLSGLGFSSTKRDDILCKVSGSFNRVVKIKF